MTNRDQSVLPLKKVSPQHLYRLIDAGNFPAPIKLAHSRIGFRLGGIEAWLASREASDRRESPTKTDEPGL